MAALADIILRGLLFVFSAISLGLSAAWAADASSAKANFGTFAAAFSLLFGVFYGAIAAFVDFLNYPLINSVIDCLNWIFLFAAATAIAAKIGAHSCSNQGYLLNTFDGSKENCHLAQASTAFLYFSWAVAVTLFIYSVIGASRGGSVGLPGRRGKSSGGVPTLSQV